MQFLKTKDNTLSDETCRQDQMPTVLPATIEMKLPNNDEVDFKISNTKYLSSFKLHSAPSVTSCPTRD